jgi:Protein of unknown function (DUF4245)
VQNSPTGPEPDPELDEPEPDEDEPVRTRRTSRPVRDMAISLLVLLIPVAFVVVLFRLRGGEDVVVVDPAPAISQAARSFPALAPHGLPDGWRTVLATAQRESDGNVLRVGYVTPDNGALQLVESTEPLEELLIRELGDQTRPTGPVTVNGVDWRSYDVRTSEKALVRADTGRTIIVIGKANAADLRALAASVG